MSDTHDRIEAILRRYSGCGESFPIRTLTSLERDLELDSLDRIEIGQALEEEFGLEIPDDHLDLPPMGTFGGLCEYIERRIDGAQLAA
jgi:acyl carrier protein